MFLANGGKHWATICHDWPCGYFVINLHLLMQYENGGILGKFGIPKDRDEKLGDAQEQLKVYLPN